MVKPTKPAELVDVRGGPLSSATISEGELVQHQPAAIACDVSTNAVALLAVIERVATNPAADIDKLERMLAMHQRLLDSQARAAYYDALAQLQPELPTIDEKGVIKDKRGNVRSTYAKFEDMHESLRPVLSKHGFAISFSLDAKPDEKLDVGVNRITCTLAHKLGHSESTSVYLPDDDNEFMSRQQRKASAISYGKRLTSVALLNVQTRGEDNDASGGAKDTDKPEAVKVITAKQVAELEALATEVGADMSSFVRVLKVDALENLPASKYRGAVARLEEKRQKTK